MTVDLLAIAAHRDDVEQTCGGTLIRMAERGYRTGVLDLTAGEMGTRGDAAVRAQEAQDAAREMLVCWRGNLGLPDARLEATLEDITGTIHAHPTLAEAIGEAAWAASGGALNLPKPRERAQ